MVNKCVKCVSAAALGFAVLVWATALGAKSVPTEKTFEIGKGGALIVNIEGAGADISVTPWERNAIEMRITGLSEEALEDLETSVEGNTVRVELFGDDGWRGSRSARFSFKVPREINLDLGTRGGDIMVEGRIKGTVDVGTSGGDIEIGDIDGDVDGKTSGGDVEVGKVTGKVDLKTSGGDISAVEVIGNAKLETSGGDIDVGNVKGTLAVATSGGDITVGSVEKTLTAATAGGDISIEDVGGDAKVSTAGGDIVVGKVSGSAAVKTAGGDIQLRGASGTVEAKTAGGDIECADVTGTLQAATAGGDVYAELDPKGGGTSELETQGGDVRIVLPAGAKATIDARIRIRGGWGDEEEYEITSDFTAESHNKDKKLITARYVLNGGGPTIKLETVNGNIEIRKATRSGS
jgi:DUF4097 and DUF4098 domain-containing protein YvlB